MFIKTRCPVCKKIIYPNINLKFSENNCQYDLRNTEINNVVTEEEMVKQMIPELRRIITDGIEIENITKLLQNKYLISAPACKGLIDRIKLEFDMYSPDRVKLYYV